MAQINRVMIVSGCGSSHLFPFGLGDVPRLRCSTGDRFGERFIIIELPFSFSGDGDEPPPAEFLRDGVRRIVASKCLNLKMKNRKNTMLTNKTPLEKMQFDCMRPNSLPNWHVTFRSIVWASKQKGKRPTYPWWWRWSATMRTKANVQLAWAKALRWEGTYLPWSWRLNGWCSFGNRWIILRWHSWRARFIDCRIINFRITDHSHEEWTFLCQSLFSLAIQNFGKFVGLIFLQQFSGEICDYLPSNICQCFANNSKWKMKHF